MNRCSNLFFVAIFLLFVAGCSNNVSLKGKVTYSDDNSPLSTGMVCFVKGDFLARGELDKSGNYIVRSVNERDGIPPGTYQIYIINAMAPGELGEEQKNIMPDGQEITGAAMRQMVPIIDLKYTRPETSGLTLNVDGKSKSYNLVVDRFVQ